MEPQTQIIKKEQTAQIITTTEDLKLRIKEETDQRALITEFISSHMKSGVDYGTIKFTTKSGVEKESKPSLFKPGSEKFCSLLHLRPVFERDNDTWEMSGKVSGLFTYKCQLLSNNGMVVGEGRGAAKLTEKMGWTENNAIKIAEKRAQIDAVLRTGGLSDFFTQDLEDMSKEQVIEGNVIEGTVKVINPIEDETKKVECPHCHTTGQYHSRTCPNFKQQ